MKNHADNQTSDKINFNKTDISLNLFEKSNSISKKNSTSFLKLSRSKKSTKQKIESIKEIRNSEIKTYKSIGAFKSLKRDFHIDGAIKLHRSELELLENSIKSSIMQGIKFKNFNSSKEILDEYTSKFGYFSGDNFIFRGPAYYFILNGIEIENFNPFTSINDFTIKNIDIDKFITSICDQYNSINDHLQIFDLIHTLKFAECVTKNKDKFFSDIKEELSQENIDKIKKNLQLKRITTGLKQVDKVMQPQWELMLATLEKFNSHIIKCEETNKIEDFVFIVNFFKYRHFTFEQCKLTFNIDLDSAFAANFKIEIQHPIRKIILGLLDAKINILAFLQNIFQIITNRNFLDPDYQGSLIIEQDTVRYIKKTCPLEFSKFKDNQREYIEQKLRNPIRQKIDEVVKTFMEIMLKSTGTSYMRLADFSDKSEAHINRGKAPPPRIMSNFIKITEVFFELINKFTNSCDLIEQKKIAKNNKNHKKYTPHYRHIEIKQKIYKRIVRLYREENSPLVMIKTAQNALNFILCRGYNFKNDVLHIMSVNYGGALTGFFAKQVFLRCAENEKAFANVASIIYSLYDVKNANTFTRLADYPFCQIITDENISDEEREKFSNENWLLIFDDNTNSGETLDNIRKLAKETRSFGRINMFPCRASFDLSRYKKSLNEHQKLTMIANSALEVRRTKINKEGIRYKELLGTIVGHRLWKLKSRGFFPKQINAKL